MVASGGQWGIWDWDYQCSLLEAARKTIVEYGQWPLWNPWLGGGHSLAGHPLGHTANPSFLPVLLFGTLPGVKIDLVLYMLLGQIGMARLLRALGCDWVGACVGALVASWGGCYAMHLAHGHFEWMAYAWVPWMLAGLERGVRTRAPAAVLEAGVFAALTWLDGGPYQLGFLPLFVGAWAVATSLERWSLRPMALAFVAGVTGLLLAAIRVLPVVAFSQSFPRETEAVNNYYGAPFTIGIGDVLWQMLVARAQWHDPEAWMPFRINVGAYVGWLPLGLAVVALMLAPRRALRWLGLLLVSLGIALSATQPLDLWTRLHELPGYASLQIPVRFNAFVLLAVGVLAGLGADALARRGRAWRVGAAAVGLAVALDLLLVNSRVLDVAFTVPPVTLGRDGNAFRYVTRSEYAPRYASTASRPIWPNWPSATLPYVHANVGVVLSYPDIPYPRMVAPSDHPQYPGAEAFAIAGTVRVVDSRWTPNAVTLTLDGEGGTVVVNRNAQDGWTLVEAPDGAALDRVNGLVAVRVPPGRHEVTVAFRPPLFVLGACISGVAWLALLAAWLVPRRRATAAAAVLLVLGAVGCGDPAPSRVLLVTCDTLRPDRLSLYGYDRPTSPRLDAFARDAVVFERAWSCAPHTAPALSALMTSRLPDEVGMADGNRMLMPARVETLAESLRARGVATGAVVSNWVLRKPRQEDGDVGLAQGFDLYDDRMDAQEANRPGHRERRGPATTDAALALVDALPPDRPAVLWGHYQDPHGPYTPPVADRDLFARADPGDLRLPLGTTQSGLGQIPLYQALDGETRAGIYRDLYDAEIHLFDRELGRLLDGLDGRGWLRNTTIVFSADHGESLGERDYWFCHEAHVFTEQVAVPLVVRPSGGRPGGPHRNREVVSHLDVLPTVFEAFGFPVPPARGVSLLGTAARGDRLAVSTFLDITTPEGWLGLTQGSWRLVATGGTEQLFDVARDPGELVDVSGARPEVVRELRDAYARFRADAPSPPITQGVDRFMDDRTRDALRALGYLE